MTDPRLIQAVQELDPGTRALLDLSLRRAIPDEKVAALLSIDVSEVPRRRARGLGELADKLEVPGPAELALLLVALPGLPEEAWEVPAPKLPKPPRKVTKARRVKAFRRAAVAASPLVAAAAVMAALIVSGGAGPKGTSSSGGGAGAHPGHGVSAAAAQGVVMARAPSDADPRHSLPRGTGVTALWGPTGEQLFANAVEAKRRAAARDKGAIGLPLSSDHFASSIPRPDNFVNFAPEPPPPPPAHHEDQTVAAPQTPIVAPSPEPPATFVAPPDPIVPPVVTQPISELPVPTVTPPVTVTPPTPPVAKPPDLVPIIVPPLPPVDITPPDTNPPDSSPASNPPDVTPPPGDQGGGCADGQSDYPPPDASYPPPAQVRSRAPSTTAPVSLSQPQWPDRRDCQRPCGVHSPPARHRT
ncbi:MAG: hypothetical protein ACXVRH_04535, partial [Thermoleophilaceae bacterium]